MNTLLWSLPALAVVVAIALARLNTTWAASLGLLIAIPVAMLTGPLPLGLDALPRVLARGLWIGATIAPYLLGGLVFWQIASRSASAGAGNDTGGLASLGKPSPTGTAAPAQTPLARRRLLFFACFLIGPFAESATGFGVGMLGTIALIGALGIAPRFLMIFALLSQTMIPWGAMGSGTLLAAAYARMPAAQLGVSVMLPIALLMGVWLVCFWRTAAQAGFSAPARECVREAVWIVAALALLMPATAALGPETALLAVYGPLIVLRYWLDARPDRPTAITTARRTLPFALLIVGLVVTRLTPELRTLLATLGRLMPFDDLPAWSPCLHAGSWLLAGGLLTALLRGQPQLIGPELRKTWATGRHAVLGIFLFAMMAEVLTAAGIARAIAEGLFATLREGAVIVTPLLAGLFGILTNSGNAPNSLFMPSQLALATQAGLSVSAVAALQHVSGSSLSLFSPVRMTIAAGLCQGIGEERRVYRLLTPYALACVTLLVLRAAWIVAF